jgi:hypothetical protein
MDNIKLNATEIIMDGVETIDLVQDKDQWKAPVNAVINLHT